MSNTLDCTAASTVEDFPYGYERAYYHGLVHIPSAGRIKAWDEFLDGEFRLALTRTADPSVESVARKMAGDLLRNRGWVDEVKRFAESDGALLEWALGEPKNPLLNAHIQFLRTLLRRAQRCLTVENAVSFLRDFMRELVRVEPVIAVMGVYTSMDSALREWFAHHYMSQWSQKTTNQAGE
jgi:hypothetical protein